MYKIINKITLFLVILLTGCAGTSAVIKSDYRMQQGDKLKLQLTSPPDTSKEDMVLLRERLIAQLSSNALLAEVDDITIKMLDVSVNNYRMRNSTTRALVGIMAGADNIHSTVKIKELATGEILSEFNVESTNPTAWGTSKGLIEEHADKIVETLNSVKRQ